jgi:hypothetical protein
VLYALYTSSGAKEEEEYTLPPQLDRVASYKGDQLMEASHARNHRHCVCCLSSVCLLFFYCFSIVCLLYVCCLSAVCLLFVCCFSIVCLLFVCCLSAVCLLYVC